MIDAAGSIHWEDLKNISEFIKSSIRQLDIDTGRMRVSLMYYSDTPTLLLNLNNVSVIDDYFFYADSLPFPSGKTNIAAALQYMMTNVFNGQGGDRPLVLSNIAVILTDIVPTVDANLTAPMAIQAHIAGIYTILVTVGQGLNVGRNYIALHTLASEPYARNFLSVDSFSQLVQLAPQVADAMCNGMCLSWVMEVVSSIDKLY